MLLYMQLVDKNEGHGNYSQQLLQNNFNESSFLRVEKNERTHMNERTQ